jgi:hypothetical protein
VSQATLLPGQQAAFAEPVVRAAERPWMIAPGIDFLLFWE